MNSPIAQPKTRVLIVDDSAVIRAILSRTLSAQTDIEIAGVAGNGETAIRSLRNLDPDIVILDLEMPVMDGLTALPLLLREKPSIKVLICSSLSSRGAEVTLKALALGAAECILKPGAESQTAESFQAELVRLVRTLGTRIRLRQGLTASPASSASAGGAAPARPVPAAPIVRKTMPSAMVLRPKIVAIGSSTGGPKALLDVMKNLRDLPVPIVITQHMPKTFTTMLAQHIEQASGIPCIEGADGMVLEAGRAYVAPGGYHMVLRPEGKSASIRLTEDAPEHFCRPSVNPMMRSLVPIYGGGILSVILTGMGSDGIESCRDVVAAGGRVIAQDEETSVVWGMPGAVANDGLCTAILPLGKIGEWIRHAVEGRA